MEIPRHLMKSKSGVSSIFIAIYISILVVTLLSILFFGLSITHSSLINYMQNDQDRNQEMILIRGPGALNVSGGVIHSLLVNNTGGITVRIKAIYIGGVLFWDPSTFPGDSYIPPQSSLWITLSNPTINMDNTILRANWTVTTERGTRASETGQNLWLGSPIAQYEANKFYFGPLLLIFNYFEWSTNGGDTWNSGWTIPQDASNVIWRILVADIDDRSIALTADSSFALVQNSQQSNKIATWKIGPSTLNPSGLLLDPGYYYFLCFSVDGPNSLSYMATPIPITSNFVTILGNFVEIDGSLTGFAQTIPFEAVKISGLQEIDTYTTLNAFPSPQTVGQPVAVSGTVTVDSGQASVPSNNIVMIEYCDVGSENWDNILNPSIQTGSSGTFTGSFSPPHAGTFEFRAMFIGATQGQVVWTASASTSQTITVQKATSTTTMQTISPITIGQSISARATVNPSFATGTVTFEVSTDSNATYTILSTNPVSAGSAVSNQYMPPAPGSNYRFRATYNGDADVLSSPTSAPVTLTVNKANPTVTTPTLNPLSPITLGQSIEATVVVNGISGFTPTGTVTFQYSTDSGSTWNTLSIQPLTSGSATSATYTPSTVGTFYRIRALYSGDSNYNSANSSSATLSVKTASSITVALTPASPITLGTQIRVIATVSGGYGTPTGNVDFYVSTNNGLTFTKLGATKTLSGGVATSDPYTPPSVGTSYQFKAIYAGNTIYFSQESAAIPLTVTSATSINLSSSTITIGQSITATATVNPSYATGTVTFEYSTDGGSTYSQLGALQPLVAGSAISGSYTPPSLGNSYRFRATYSGDANVLGSQSPPITLTVVQATAVVTTPTLNPSSPIAVGTSVEASVTVTGVSGITPTGTVTFQYSTDSGSTWNNLSTQTLTSGSATSDSYTPLTPGNYLIRAVYSGDVNYNSLTSNSASLDVKSVPSVIATLAPVSPVSLGTTVSVIATVSGGYGTPTGSVDFYVSTDDGLTFTPFGDTTTLVGGVATSNFNPISAGTYMFESAYSGDTSYFSQPSSQIFLTVI